MGHFKREALFKKIFLVSDLANKAMSVLYGVALFAFAVATILFACLVIYDIGFRTSAAYANIVNAAYIHLLSVLFTGKVIIELYQFSSLKWKVCLFKFLLLIFVFLLIRMNTDALDFSFPFPAALLHNKYALMIGALILIATEVYRISEYLSSIDVSASLLFAGSFLFVILVGSGLLMLPNATLQPISYLQALFTATSAVCVTGLTVVDPPTVFTPLGKGILLILIQIGGLGIMTFTGFFTYLFQGSATLRDRFLLKELFSGEHLGGMYKILLKIVLITLLVEASGAVFLYYTIEGQWTYKIWSCVFHSISAFCNAGFSLFPQGLYTMSIRNNYPFQTVICMLIILGGIGFPVLMTLYSFIKRIFSSLFAQLTKGKRERTPVALSISGRLAVGTTITLLAGGTLLYYLFEISGPLANDSPAGQWMTAFFGSVTARTAGFNVADMTLWSYPTVFLVIFLMWVGASPGSTGGGIKTTSLALAARTVFNFCRGRQHLEIGNREIGEATFIRVLSVIVLSLATIFAAFMILMLFDPAANPIHLLFECVSAFSTTGLSVVGTPTLSPYSQFVLIVLMFVGRIGPVILLSGLLLTKTKETYRLPVEDVSIN